MKIYIRLIVFLAVVVLSFSYLTIILFDLQIVNGGEALANLDVREPRDITIPSERGNIYDRLGRPLAINETIFSLMHDPSIELSDLEINRILTNTLRVLTTNGEIPLYNLPITQEEPFEFTFFGNFSDSQRVRFFRDANIIDSGETAEQVIEILAEAFGLNREAFIEEFTLTNIEKIQLISLRLDIFTRRFTRYNPVTISLDIGTETIATIGEDGITFASMFINSSQTRHYPGERYVSHLIGFIERMNETDELAAGRLATDLIGRDGIERAFEEELRGIHGSEVIYVNNLGRRIGVREGSFVPPVRGSDVFLTIDLQFQADAFYYLKDTLTRTIILRLRKPANDQFRLTAANLLSSLARGGNINSLLLFESEEGTHSYTIWQFVSAEVLSIYEKNEDEDVILSPYPNPNTRNGRREINNIIANGITNGDLTPMQILNVLYEQEIITSLSGANPTEIIVNRLNDGEITPQMANVDPSTGSLVVVNPNTGEVLAAVSYPSYDNNAFVNNRDNAYITRLFEDPTSPMFNRAFNERRAPGSTFKMITGIAGLTEGIITTNTRMMDQVRFTRAGYPYPTSWSSRSLGYINYSQAVALSSNYFFYDTANRLGIDVLNKYMSAFGLDRLTGVEITEEPPIMSSREEQERRDNMPAWNAGDTVRTGIGQHLNAYSAATMARATAIIASRGNATDLRLLDRIVGPNGTYIARTYPVPFEIDVPEEIWEATHFGMHQAVHHPRGTARGVFANFPMEVGVKTGTAQENRSRMNHTTFNAFAPLDDPEIALFVSMPFSDSSPAPAMQVARYVIANYFGLNQTEEQAKKQMISTILRP
ncbi:MAG: penicillin-binding transpeptidase domain-containing protein [Defluviitaleaceae bacterium]|nr:penicillin-binding transpeptidase domain-containing protein [Defluviitaleaceae bacterium]